MKVYVHNSPYCIVKNLHSPAFHENSLSVACCTFGMLEIRTLTPNRITNQSSETLNILGHNCNHQQGFVKQRTVALYHLSLWF